MPRDSRRMGGQGPRPLGAEMGQEEGEQSAPWPPPASPAPAEASPPGPRPPALPAAPRPPAPADLPSLLGQAPAPTASASLRIGPRADIAALTARIEALLDAPAALAAIPEAVRARFPWLSEAEARGRTELARRLWRAEADLLLERARLEIAVLQRRTAQAPDLIGLARSELRLGGLAVTVWIDRSLDREILDGEPLDRVEERLSWKSCLAALGLILLFYCLHRL